MDCDKIIDSVHIYLQPAKDLRFHVPCKLMSLLNIDSLVLAEDTKCVEPEEKKKYHSQCSSILAWRIPWTKGPGRP